MTTRPRPEQPFTGFALALAVSATLLVAAPAVRAQHDHAHEQEAHVTAGLTLNDGARWATDEPLRIGMERIRDAAAPALAAGSLPAADAKALATAVRDQVAYIVANCKLEPKADATLHVLIADLLAGAGALEHDPRAADGLPTIEKALRQYPEYFEHPGWRPLTPPE